MIPMYLDYRINGGLSRHAYELSKALDNLDCNVFVACVENDLMEIKNKIQVPTLHIHERTLDFLSFNLNLRRKIQDLNIDVVHSQGDQGFIFALIKKKPLVVTVHTSLKIGLRAFSANHYHPSPYFRVLSEKCIFMKADKIIVVSESLGKSIQNDYNVPDSKIVYIPNAVDIEKFNPNINPEFIRKKFDISGPLLVCVARIENGRFVQKLIPMMQEVKKEIPDIKLIHVGDGPLRLTFERLISRYGLKENILLAGARGDNELPYFYAAADLCVSPMVYSPAKKEFNVLEALASGKPLIYVNRQEQETEEELIAKAIPISVNNDNDFASSIIELIQNDKKRKKLGLIARQAIVKSYSWEQVAKETISVYTSLIS
jgi:glycosyltransferase involved in cell wall biosynthesis